MPVKNIWMMNMSKLNSYKTFANDPQTKYLKWYISLIEAANSRDCPQDTPIERHHVFPISIFGRNRDTVNLTVREHIFQPMRKIYHDPATSDPAKLFITGHQPLGWVEGRRK